MKSLIASGDHNNMGVGTAALWVKEVSREALLEPMRDRRCFATTGDKMIVDFRINGSFQGSTVKMPGAPTLNMKIRGQGLLDKLEVLRNSQVIKEFRVTGEKTEFEEAFTDKDYLEEQEVCYYYVRATQKNNEIAWSSPIWVEKE